MSQSTTQESLLTKVNSLKLQLSSALDKALKVSELEQREKYVDSISSFKRELQQLKLKLERDSDTQQHIKVYNKVALKLNTLVGEINMKQNKCLWSKENKENSRKNRVGEYGDLLQELVHRDQQIKGLKAEVEGLRRENQQVRGEYEELEGNLKIIIGKGRREREEEREGEMEESTKRIRELQGEVVENLRVISQLQGVEKENLMVCSKGAEEIHRLSKQLSLLQQSSSQLQATLQQRQLRICELESVTETQETLTTQLKIRVKDQQFKLRVNVQQLQTLKQILGKRNEEVKNVQQLYEGRIKEVKSLYERRIQQFQQELKEKEREKKVSIEGYERQLEESLNTITQLNLSMVKLRESVEEVEGVKKQLNLKHQLIHSKNTLEINRLRELCQFQESTNQQLETQKGKLEMELKMGSSWKQLQSSGATQGNYFETQQSEIKERGRRNNLRQKPQREEGEERQQLSQEQSEEIDTLSRRLIRSHIQQEKSNEEKKSIEKKHFQVLRENEQLKEQIRNGELRYRTLQITLLQLNHQIQSKSNFNRILEEKLAREQNTQRALKSKYNQIETELEAKTTALQDLQYSYKRMDQKCRQLQIQCEESHRVLRETKDESLIQYEQEIRQCEVISELRMRVGELERERKECQELMREHTEREAGETTVLGESKRYQNELNISNMSKSRSVKMRVLEDIRKIIHIME